jgi:hypothetical protein
MFANIQPCYSFRGRQIVPIVCEYLTTMRLHTSEVEFAESDHEASAEFYETDNDDYGHE